MVVEKAGGYVVPEAKPHYVDGLGFVVDSQPRSKRGEVSLDGMDADAQARGRCGMRAVMNVHPEHIELARCRA